MVKKKRAKRKKSKNESKGLASLSPLHTPPRPWLLFYFLFLFTSPWITNHTPGTSCVNDYVITLKPGRKKEGGSVIQITSKGKALVCSVTISSHKSRYHLVNILCRHQASCRLIDHCPALNQTPHINMPLTAVVALHSYSFLPIAISFLDVKFP